jgi:hypothetical protein
MQKIQVGANTEPADPKPNPNPPKPKPPSRGGGNKGGGKGSRAGVKITRVKLLPHNSWIYADGFLDMKVQVTNRGDRVARKVDVFMTSSRRGVTVPKRVRIWQILPGWTVTRSFRVRAKRSARGWVMIQANVSGKRNRSFLKLIKPWW